MANLTTLLAVYDGDDNLKQRFEYADNRMPISMTQNGNKYYLHYDQVGTLKAVSDGSLNIIKEISYDTYGNILSETNPSFKVPFGFAGGLYDSDTQLTRFGYRDYDAYTGKWTAKDPIDFDGGDSNLYGYVLGDPVTGIDPSGLEYRKKWTKDDIARTIKKIKCENLSNKEIASKYSPTNGTSPLVLRNLDTETVYGMTDIDWALTLANKSNQIGMNVPFTNYKVQARPWILYHGGKLLWALVDSPWSNFSSHMSMYRDESELNAIKMADDLIRNNRSFSDMFDVGECECK